MAMLQIDRNFHIPLPGKLRRGSKLSRNFAVLLRLAVLYRCNRR